MRSLFTSFVMGLALACHAQTPQWGQVYFDNSVFTPPRVVTSIVSGRPLVGTNFVAELYYGTNFSSMVRSTNGPGPIARFRPEGTMYPGTWSGGYRTLVGIPPGTPTLMRVWLWNNDDAESFDEAVQNSSPEILVSNPFTYTPPPPGSSIEAHYMSNFAAFQGECGRVIPTSILVQPTNQTVRVGDNVVISVVSTNACYHQWQFNGTNINVLPGSRFLVLTNVQPSQAGDYRVIIDPSSAPGWSGPTSQIARLTVEPPPQWGQVYFDNSVFSFPPDRLVRSGPGDPLVGTNFIAELVYFTNSTTQLSLTNAPPARFRPQGTPYPGTWSGGMRTLVGVPPGTPVQIMVDVWNNDVLATYDEAVRTGMVWMRSVFFNYVPPPPGSSIEAHYITNFSGFTTPSVPCSGLGQPSIRVQPTNQTVKVGDTLVLSVVSTNVCTHQWQFNGTNITVLPGSRFLLLTNVQPSQAGDYRVIVKGFFVGITSQVARLTILAPPQFMSPRYDNGAFAFQVSEETGRPVIIETAPDLHPSTTWTPVFTNTSPFAFTNSTPADRQRYYRTVLR